jgi:hypothetical protein
LPTLRTSSANDRVWGPPYPLQRYAAFVVAGGGVRFVALPGGKNKGHFIFNRNRPASPPAFAEFMNRLGLMAGPRWAERSGARGTGRFANRKRRRWRPGRGRPAFQQVDNRLGSAFAHLADEAVDRGQRWNPEA